MTGMTMLSKEEMIQTNGGFCPFTDEFIRTRIRELMDAGKTEEAAKFIKAMYELGCTGDV